MENTLASVDSCLQSSCSFLSPALFWKESRTSPSYRPLPDLCRHRGTAAHARGQLFSTSRQEGAGCHRSWFFTLHYTTYHTHTHCCFEQSLPVNKHAQNSAIQQIWPPHCSQDVLHQLVQHFQCWSGSQGTEIPTQLCNTPSPTFGPHHNQLSWDSSRHAVVSGSSVHCHGFSPLNTQNTASQLPRGLTTSGMGRERYFKKKAFPQLKEKKNPSLFGTLKKVLKFIHFYLLHSAAQVHTASSSMDLF